MNKDKKEELKKLFSIIDEKKFLKFAKSYAGKDEAFADAIIEHFMPEDKPIDYTKIIAECFAHKKKGRASSWKLNYDWAVIRKESKRVMKQLQILADGGDYASAMDGALLFLETLCKYFCEDNFDYDYTTYEGKDFSNDAALNIVRKMLLSQNGELPKQEKLRVVERLKTIAQKGVIDNYLEGDVEDLIIDAQEELLDDEQMLVALDEKIAAEKYDRGKAALIIQKVELLNDMNRQAEAEKLIKQNLHIEEIRKYDLDNLIAEKKFDEALKKCDAYIEEKNYSTKSWMIYKLDIGEKTGDKDQMRTALQWLCVYANTYAEIQKKYCTKLKAICDEQQWLKIRDVLVKEMIEKTDNKELCFWLLVQEGLNDRLYAYLSKLPLHNCFLNKMAGGDMLKYYVPFAHALAEQQQETIEKCICDAILEDATRAKTEKDYYNLKYGIEALSQARPAAHAKAVTLRDNLIRLYPKKSLLLSILEKL